MNAAAAAGRVNGVYVGADLAQRDLHITADESQLKATCLVDRFRASGPGGQHRNKTDSGVRIRVAQWDLMVTATERRSQHENREEAWARLREAVAFEVRVEVALTDFSPSAALAALLLGGTARVGAKTKVSAPYYVGMAHLLDVVWQTQFELSPAAAHLALSSSQLGKWLLHDERVAWRVNKGRQALGLRPLR